MKLICATLCLCLNLLGAEPSLKWAAEPKLVWPDEPSLLWPTEQPAVTPAVPDDLPDHALTVDAPPKAKPKVYVAYKAGPPGICPPCDAVKAADWSDVEFELATDPNPDINHRDFHYPWITWRDHSGKLLYLKDWYGKKHFVECWKQSQQPPKAATKPQAKTQLRYPTGSEYKWTGPSGSYPLQSKSEAINHLLGDSNHGMRFVRELLTRLTLSELRALHSDDHDRNIRQFSRVAIVSP